MYDEFANLPYRDVSLRELLEAAGDREDDEVFRYYQTSEVDSRGVPVASETLRITFGAARRELGISRPDASVRR